LHNLHTCLLPLNLEIIAAEKYPFRHIFIWEALKELEEGGGGYFKLHEWFDLDYIPYHLRKPQLLFSQHNPKCITVYTLISLSAMLSMVKIS
jgi:hypothetical protein